MKLTFLNRDAEQRRLQRFIGTREPGLAVVYGRRRCGKSTLLQNISRPGDVYYLADQREASLQIRGLAAEASRIVSGFNQVEYPSWEVLFTRLKERLPAAACVMLDEFPYLVQAIPELPSILQKLADTGKLVRLILCGSSQRMMQGLVLDANAPLYGRAREIIKIGPLQPGWIVPALKRKAGEAIESYARWGGVPRYWELAAEYTNDVEAIRDLVLDRNGVLHEEPKRLLLGDLRSTTQSHSVLSLVATGCHRLNEIASRLNKPATSLVRPLGHLIDLGYLKRELPFGQDLKSTKRTLYKLADPFLRFWYRFVLPHQSQLERGLTAQVEPEITRLFSSHVGEVWEELARESIAGLTAGNRQWQPGQRWWGKGRDGKDMEIDVVALSKDKQALLLGEAKWADHVDVAAVNRKLAFAAKNLPGVRKKEIHYAVWVKDAKGGVKMAGQIFKANDVLKVMR